MTRPIRSAARRSGIAALCALLGGLPRLACAQQSGTAARDGHAAGSLPTPRQIIDRHIEAVGGRAALLKVRSRYVWAKVEIPSQGAKGELELFAARPNKLVVKTTFDDLGTTVTGFDGTVGWMTSPGAKPALLKGAELAQLRDEAAFDADLHADEHYASMETVEQTECQPDRRPCYHVRLVTASGRELNEFYDVASGLFVGALFRRETAKGPVLERRVVSKYTVADGIRVPAKIVIRAGAVETVIRVMKVQFDTDKVRSSVFDLPPKVRALVGR